ncbi:MAG: redox-sensing transcriptional repressor Rex [Planctomycetota bacterium]|jgi:redox-sensing transcriptional repressor|nr:redox-sensing transcriptional repressor Rex [Planctomycetota bacterium]
MVGKSNSVRINSLPGVRRLPFYLNILRRMRNGQPKIISAVALAEEAGQAVSVVKKDIEMTGAVGKTGVGYEVAALIGGIEKFLGWTEPCDAFLLGVGNLGSALLGYGGFRRYGLRFVASFDVDQSKVGSFVHGVEVFPPAKIAELARKLGAKTGVLTVPAEHAQESARIFVDSGMTRIWSFAPIPLTVPDGVIVQREDLTAGLAELMVRCRNAGRGS